MRDRADFAQMCGIQPYTAALSLSPPLAAIHLSVRRTPLRTFLERIWR
jgi:hypothetical protein